MLQTLLILGILLIASQVAFAQQGDDLAFPPATSQTKPWTRWWWPGSAVDAKNLTRELQQLHDAGIGGVEITPIYGTQTSESRDIDFLSPKWIEMLRHVGAETRRLDMGVDMATCTGWPFGGPMVVGEFIDQVVAIEGGKLVSRPSGMKVKRAAPGGAGWVLNPYSVPAIEMYLKSFDVLPKGVVRAQFHDSFEYSGNWTDLLPAKFQQMHGYDLRDHAAALFGNGDPDTVARVKSDYRQTLGQMHLDYIRAWAKWCRDRGELPRNQAHGAPGNLLDLYAASDIPETEIFGSTPFTIPGFRRDASDIDPKNEPNPRISKFASSAAHVAGKPLASCETLTWLREHFRVSLSMCKPELDQMFLAGINHIIFHGTCYSPDDAEWPGWLFYASSEINPLDSIWRDLPQMNAYIARCQSILQSGQPDNDVLLYWPVWDSWHSTDRMQQQFTVHAAKQWLDASPFGATSRELTELGYGQDYISDAQLQETTGDGTMLKTAGGARYQALMVPDARLMAVETLEKIVSLASGGATVIVHGELPRDVPGLAKLDARRAQLKQILGSLTFAASGIGPRVADIGRGRIVVGQSLRTILPLVKLRHESIAGDGVGVIRRRFDGGYHYFIANLGTRTIDGWAALAVPCESAVLLDPLAGNSGVAAHRRTAGGSEIYLQLKPGQSIIVRTFASRQVQGPKWTYTESAAEPIQLAGAWQIDFIDGAPVKPKPIKTDTLTSWTDLGDAEAKRFAGTARYRIEFDRPATISGPCLLDLGDVRESARVRLNGADVGTAWSLPMQVRLPELRATGNVLEIEVTNLSANRLRDLDQRGVQWRIMKEINYVNIHYRPFDASGWADTPSGLLGPVKLVPLKALTP